MKCNNRLSQDNSDKQREREHGSEALVHEVTSELID